MKMAEKYKEGMSVEQKRGLFSDEFFEAKESWMPPMMN
jgi:hypothetical protein